MQVGDPLEKEGRLQQTVLVGAIGQVFRKLGQAIQLNWAVQKTTQRKRILM